MEVRGLFPVPILRHQVSDDIADKIHNMYLERIDKLPFQDIKYSDYIQADRLIILEKDVPELLAEMNACKDEFIKASRLSITEGELQYWVQDYRDKGNYIQRHHHGLDGISGVYWIMSENAHPLILHNPNPIADYVNFIDRDTTAFTEDKFAFHGKKGMLLLFPSYLQHEVEPSVENNTVRATMAFNYVYAGIGTMNNREVQHL